MSTLTSQHIQNIIGILNEQADYAVLRNFEGLPDSNDSRDIDIIITRSSFRAVRSLIVEAIDKSGWKIVNYLHSDRLITFVCGRMLQSQEEGSKSQSQEEGTKPEMVQWDFFFDTSVFGIRLMGAEEFLKYKTFNGFLYCVGVECQFLDKYLYNRAVGAKYPEKYHATREAAEHSSIVTSKLAEIYGCSTAEQCDKMPKSVLLRRAFLHNFSKNPIGAIHSLINFCGTFAGNYICSRTGFSIGFTGPDGSGKTTVISTMIESLSPVFAKAHAYYHFRPTLYGNLGDVAHSAGIKKDVDRNYDNPHRGSKTGKLSSVLRLFYYTVDYILGYFLKVKTVTRITKLVIFDRYYTDIVCDSRRSRIYLNYKFLHAFGKLLVPSLDYNILLTAQTSTILDRKGELNASEIEIINEKIDYLASKRAYLKVSNDGTPQEAVDKILSYVFEHQHAKNLKRLR